MLDQASDISNPLLERCKFLAIFQSNLDEFFMVRVGSLLNEKRLAPDAREEQLDVILAEVKKLYKESASVYQTIAKELNARGVRLMRPHELSPRKRTLCLNYFLSAVLPLLSPMVLDAKTSTSISSTNCSATAGR